MKNAGLLAGVVAATLGFSNVAHAGDCWTMLQKHFTWAQSDGGYKNNHLTFQMTTNRGDARYVSYATGVMDVTPENPWLFTTTAGRHGNRDGTQYFSDRQYQQCEWYGCLPVGPFDRNNTDVLGMRMTWSGQVTLTLRSWGGGEMSGTGDCTNEMLFAHIGDTAFVFSFKQTSTDIVR